MLDQSILSKVIRGELVPQDPNDEPASVLLDRIRREKERLATEEKPIPKRKNPKIKELK
jgi:type I restriction enzyme S subunit